MLYTQAHIICLWLRALARSSNWSANFAYSLFVGFAFEFVPIVVCTDIVFKHDNGAHVLCMYYQLYGDHFTLGCYLNAKQKC